MGDLRLHFEDSKGFIASYLSSGSETNPYEVEAVFFSLP